MSKETEGPWTPPFEVGDYVILLHSDPMFDEPHQIPGELVAIEPCKKGLNIKVKTEYGIFLVRGVNEKNFSLVFEP